jgi:predicted acetyltransferase
VVASLEVRALFPGAAPRLHAGFEALAASHPPEPHWYLAFVGIDPAQQRRGLGRTILAPVLARADADAIPCYLETPFPDTRAFYKTLGFDETDELHPVAAAPPIWTMTRPAARESRGEVIRSERDPQHEEEDRQEKKDQATDRDERRHA